MSGVPPSSGPSETSRFSSSSSWARFFFGDEICSFRTSSLAAIRLMGGVRRRRAAAFALGVSSSEALLSSCDSCAGSHPAFSERVVCFSSRLAAVVWASSFAAAAGSAWSEMSLVLCGSSAMVSEVGS